MTEVTQPIVSNEFGTVYIDRIGFYARKGWLSGGAMEELPIRHVTSVSISVSRNVVFGSILLLIGLSCLAASKGQVGVLLFSVIFLAFGAMLLWGSPSVRVNTAGGDLRPARGWPWQRDAADAYVAGVRKALFDRADVS